MNRYKSLGLIGLAAASLFATQAIADPVGLTCPTSHGGTPTATQGSAACISPHSDDGVDDNLNYQLSHAPGDGGILVSGPAIDPYNGQQPLPTNYWHVGGTGSNSNTIVLEIAGNASTNTFGIFDPSDPTHRLQMFSGPQSAGATDTLSYNGGGSFTTSFGTATFGEGNKFGYYLFSEATNTYFYSDMSLNKLTGDPNYYTHAPHMATFIGNGLTTLKTGAGETLFGADMYLLGWEDLPWLQSDLDYNDFLVLVQEQPPHQNVPEPAALGMFGLGALMIGLFAGLRRRREEV